MDIAALLAARLHQRLTIVHAVNEPSRTMLPRELRESLALFERKYLHDEIERVTGMGVCAEEDVRAGKPEEVVLRCASEDGVNLLVLAAGQHSRILLPKLGSVAEQVAAAAPVPTLIVRPPTKFIDWLEGRQKIRLFVAADLTPASEAALRWAMWLQQLGNATLVVAHIEREPAEALSSYVYAAPAVVPVCEAIHRGEERCFRQFVREILQGNPARVVTTLGWDRSDAHLIHLALEEKADLVVVGSHGRRGFGRFFHRSVSRGLLNYAPVSIACVPAGASLTQSTN